MSKFDFNRCFAHHLPILSRHDSRCQNKIYCYAPQMHTDPYDTEVPLCKKHTKQYIKYILKHNRALVWALSMNKS